MPAPTANRNAEKWTLQATLDKLDDLDYYAKDDRTLTLTMALVKVKIYPGIWAYWKKRWIDHDEIMEQIYWIEAVFLAKLQDGALSKRFNGSAAIFMLKCNYGMRDKPMKKDEHIPEEKLLPHLQEELDRIQMTEQIAAMQQAQAKANEQQIISPAPQIEVQPQRTIAVPMISYTEVECPEPQRSNDYQAEPEAWLNKPALLEQAA
jgi:hypothetical protein